MSAQQPRRSDYVDLGCMCACYALIAVLAVMAFRPDLVLRVVWALLS